MAERLLDDIKSKIDIVDVISDYVHLKKAGQNWKGLCPFHTEKTPSFTVSPSRQRFHCFGCGVGGDVIQFITEHEKYSFKEALDVLAKRAGITIPVRTSNGTASEKNEQLREVIRKASHFYRENIQSSGAASRFFTSRGITDESVQLFLLGYAPPGWGNLLNYLRRSGYRDEIMKEAGLVVQGKKGYYDMFRERLIFPIMTANGTVCAFGGRALDDSMPKYINSPETAIFKKSEILYGLHAAREGIRRQGFVMIVEGYMDVIICNQHGYDNAVAPLGTALTSESLKKLKPLTSAVNVVVVFDGDAAGVAAAQRALPLLCQNNLRAKVLLLPENEDPDSYLEKYGNTAFNALLDTSVSMIDFILRVTAGDETDKVHGAVTLISENTDSFMADQMLIELSGKTRISESLIREKFKKLKNRAGKNKPNLSSPVRGKINREEHLLLSVVLAFPEKADQVLSQLELNDLRDKTVASLFNNIAALENKADISEILHKTDDKEKKLFDELSMNPGFDFNQVDRIVEDCLGSIEKRKFDEQFHHAKKSGDLHRMHSLLRERKKA
ncbi:MAG: DNA primase [Nitrospiraceae bacterium]|nr:MAG: DNA primase [Nitrospiraceae bacterium]